MPELTAIAWVLLGISAVLVGISKTALPGANTISIAIFAALLPARESTGALLLLLIVADAFAIWTYRKHADWAVLRRLVPTVLAGLVLGAVFLALADDAEVRRVIGVILLLVIGITIWRRQAERRRDVRAAREAAAWEAAAREEDAHEAAGVGQGTTLGSQSSPHAPPSPHAPVAGRAAQHVQAGIYGTLGGFTTMVANAAGPVMSMYFLASKFSVKTFLGTAAWFFAVVNLVKLPFSVGIGLITVPTLLMDLVLVPTVVLGAFVGRWLVARMNQALFERLVIALTIVGAGYLLF
ncbi:sulfite exporter TauE/SafE family protein [Ruania alkalisoli]|uniref:Probable membrane transporter protein n=1 Tax=Ruania alkalisoli TaxID=2779775 RepID=A0A7M1SSU0_9MICO|nr:sulfite exporter TauE/SafE family protein [Ruania alkalisoli]QOR70629.1 sulfite exporter TauE/SafE family protein [Ruania alkalisoli]